MNNFFRELWRKIAGRQDPDKPRKINAIIVLIIFFLLGNLASSYFNLNFNLILEKFQEYYGPKPDIISNVIILKNADINEQSNRFTNFNMLYYLRKEFGFLYIIDSNNITNINDYGMVFGSANADFLTCPNCVFYELLLKNIGDKKANKIVIDIKSDIKPTIILDSPKITKNNCGGIFTSKGCNLIIEDLESQDEVFIEVEVETKSNFDIVSCKIDNKYDCNIRYINTYMQVVDLDKSGLMINDKRIILPTLEEYDANTLFLFNPSDSSWTIQQSYHDEIEIKT